MKLSLVSRRVIMHFVPYFIIQNHLGHNNAHTVSLHNLGLEFQIIQAMTLSWFMSSVSLMLFVSDYVCMIVLNCLNLVSATALLYVFEWMLTHNMLSVPQAGWALRTSWPLRWWKENPMGNLWMFGGVASFSSSCWVAACPSMALKSACLKQSLKENTR